MLATDAPADESGGSAAPPLVKRPSGYAGARDFKVGSRLSLATDPPGDNRAGD